MKRGKSGLICFVIFHFSAMSVFHQSLSDSQKPFWPEQIKEIRYYCSADKSLQPAQFYKPDSNTSPLPLLVALHTWSGNYKQKMSIPYAKWCIDKNWVFIHPNFRGPNRKPLATGSELVVADIISAVNYARQNANVDPNRIYLIGVSGGGYTALLMAGKAPEIWAGVSAWASITDLKAWYIHCNKHGIDHAQDILKSCGGPPGSSDKVDKEYIKRSPITYLENADKVNLDINTGINDGHTGDVPVSHSLIAFNLVCKEKDRISKKDIKYFTEKAEVPLHLKTKIEDPHYGEKQPLFRRKSGTARITIFDGGHEIIYEAALSWLSKQKRKTTIPMQRIGEKTK